MLSVDILNCPVERFINPPPTQVLALDLDRVGLQTSLVFGRETKRLGVLVEGKGGSLVKAQRIFSHRIRVKKDTLTIDRINRRGAIYFCAMSD